MNSDTVWNKT